MAIDFVVINGPQKGRRFQIYPGLVVGREDFQDRRVSAQHGRVIENTAGKLILQDLASRNGIKIQSKRVPEVLLKVGTRLTLGDTVLEVIDRNDSIELPDKNLKDKKSKDNGGEKKKKPSWNDGLLAFANKVKNKIKNTEPDVEAFEKILHLQFVRGLQSKTRWTIGYGPRRCGPGSPDLTLFESDVPEICFELRPSNQSALFRTNFPEKVRLNGQSVKEQILKSGDVIGVGNSLIEVEIDS